MNQNYIPPEISNELGRFGPTAAADRNLYSRGMTTKTLIEIDGIPVTDLVKRFARVVEDAGD